MAGAGRRIRRALKALLLLIVLAAVGGVVTLALLTREQPQWYAPPSPADEQVAHVADRTEYGVIEQAQKVRPGDERWAMRLDEADVNAWLVARLPQWLAHDGDAQWPEHLGTPQVNLRAEVVEIGIPVDMLLGRRLLIAELRPSIRDGSLWLRLERVAIGTMTLPGDPVDALLSITGDLFDDLTEADRTTWGSISDILTGAAPLDPVIELADTREVELLELRCEEGAVEFVSRTKGP